AIPLGPSTVRNRPVSTPAASSVSRSRGANTSVPTAPRKRTRPPERLAATAWLAPLPPGTVAKSRPAIVSPGSGRRVTVVTRSMLTLPSTAITGARPACSVPSSMPGTQSRTGRGRGRSGGGAARKPLIPVRRLYPMTVETTAELDVREAVHEAARRARIASRALAQLTTAQKNDALHAAADTLLANAEKVLAANAEDIAAAEA